MRGEWIEICWLVVLATLVKSLPMRGEWIEITYLLYFSYKMQVSPHAGRVD